MLFIFHLLPAAQDGPMSEQEMEADQLSDFIFPFHELASLMRLLSEWNTS
jgi:hypothetical protein